MREQLIDEITHAQEEAEESMEHMNSYGHGYDVGYLDGLKRALALLNEQPA